MAALTSQAATTAGIVPAPVAVAASDTIASGQFGSVGVYMRVINGGGSPDNVTVADPNATVQGNPGTAAVVAVANATTRVIFIPYAAVNQATGLATITHSFITSVTCEVWRAP